MPKPFRGFSEELFAFLKELRINNNRDWFNANKAHYRDVVVKPVGDFITAMAPRLQRISTRYNADPRPNGGSMFRIYRDTRFSRDKRPYKEHVGCQFRHQAGRDAHAPCFYVHLAVDELFFGGGVWTPPNPVLNKIRDAIVERPERWKTITSSRSFTRRFDGIHGDGLKRPPRGYDADHPHVEDLKRKTYFAVQKTNPELAITPQFMDEVTQAFKAASPLMEFLTTSLELPY